MRPPPVPKARSGEVTEPPCADAPEGDGPGWIEWCGERMFAVGFTSGGAPTGCADETDEDGAWLPDDNDPWR